MQVFTHNGAHRGLNLFEKATFRRQRLEVNSQGEDGKTPRLFCKQRALSFPFALLLVGGPETLASVVSGRVMSQTGFQNAGSRSHSFPLSSRVGCSVSNQVDGQSLCYRVQESFEARVIGISSWNGMVLYHIYIYIDISRQILAFPLSLAFNFVTLPVL